MRIKATLLALPLAVLLATTSCSLIDPIVVLSIQECEPGATGATGKACAAKLRTGYLGAVQDRERINTATNAGLLALVTAFGVLTGLDMINTETILAGGIGGAAILATPRIFGSDQRDFTFLAGAEAMTCVLDAARPALDLAADATYLDAVDTKRDEILQDIGKLERLNAGVAPEPTSAVERNLKAALAEATAVYLKSGGLLRAVKASDARVLNAARSIDIKVNTALTQQRTDPLTLASSLGASTTLVQGQIGQFLPEAAPPLVAPDGVELDETSADEMKQAIVDAKTKILALQAVTEDMERAVSPFVSASLRKRCTLNSPDIIPFSTDPTRLTLPASDGSTPRSATIVVQGGKASHSAALVGNLPAKPDALVVSMEETRDGFAKIRLTATPALGGGAYRLRVSDREGRSTSVPIVVGGAPASKPLAKPKKAAPEQTKIDEVETLQRKLKALAACTLKASVRPTLDTWHKKVDPGEPDGILGGETSKTRLAIDNVLTLSLPGEDSLPKTWDNMTGDVKTKAIAVTKRVETIGTAICGP